MPERALKRPESARKEGRVPDKSERGPERARKSKRVPEARESQRGGQNAPKMDPEFKGHKFLP